MERPAIKHDSTRSSPHHTRNTVVYQICEPILLRRPINRYPDAQSDYASYPYAFYRVTYLSLVELYRTIIKNASINYLTISIRSNATATSGSLKGSPDDT